MSQNGRRCGGTNRKGEPCGSPVVGPDGWCDLHRPGNEDEARRRAHRGGEVTRMLEGDLRTLPPLESPEAAQEWCERIGRAVTAGRITGSAAQAGLRAVREWREAHEAEEMAERLERLSRRVEELKAAGAL